MTEPICEWCGHAHAATALCTRRPRWSRRGFLALVGAGVAGLALPAAVPVQLTIPFSSWTPVEVFSVAFNTLPSSGAVWQKVGAIDNLDKGLA